MHQSELVERLGLTPSTISKTVSGMVRREYLVRIDDDVDERRVLVQLTEVGEKAYLAALAMLRADRILREKLELILTTISECGRPQGMSVEEHRENGMALQHRRLRGLARGFQYWADDLYEPEFDAMVMSPIQHVFVAIRSLRAQARKRNPAHTARRCGAGIALWEHWGESRPRRRAAPRRSPAIEPLHAKLDRATDARWEELHGAGGCRVPIAVGTSATRY